MIPLFKCKAFFRVPKALTENAFINLFDQLTSKRRSVSYIKAFGGVLFETLKRFDEDAKSYRSGRETSVPKACQNTRGFRSKKNKKINTKVQECFIFY